MKFKKFGRLPGRPSALIRLALSDFKRVEKSKRYEVNMDTWLSPIENGKCAVCLAGAVMAKTLKIISFNPFNNHISESEFTPLNAIDWFRQGQIRPGLRVLEIDEQLFENQYVTPYDESPTEFRNDMNRLADAFEKLGL